MPKPQLADIEGLLELKNMLQSIKDITTAAVLTAQHVQKSVDATLEAGRLETQAHLDRKEVRPVVKFKPLPRNQWAIIIGKELYAVGPLPNFAQLDDEALKFYWQHGDGPPVPIESMFKALMGIMQHYFNDTNEWYQGIAAPMSHPATGSVTKPIDNPIS